MRVRSAGEHSLVERATEATVATPADLPRPPEEVYARLCALLEANNYDEATCTFATDTSYFLVTELTPELAGRLRDHIVSRSAARKQETRLLESS